MPVCEAMRLSPTRPTCGGVGDDFVNEEQGPCSPLLPSSPTPPSPHTRAFTFASNIRLSHTLTLLSLSLSLSIYIFLYLSLSLPLSLLKLAQLSISPPAVPPAVCPPRTRSPTTIQVTGQEKEQAAFTMDQWRPVKQSFPVLRHSSTTVAGTGKDKPLERWLKGQGGYGGTSPTTYNCLKNHIDKHSNTHLFSLFSRCLCGSLSNSRAITLFNAVIKVKTENLCRQ